MKKNRIIFIVIFILFTITMILFTIDMNSRTTPPWEKKAKEEKAE